MRRELNDEAKELKRQEIKDVLTVLAILSSVFVLALLIAWFKSGERIIKEFTGSSMAEARKIYESSKTAILCVGILSLLVLIVYVAYSVQERKKRKQKRNAKKAFIDYDRLEMARIRVEKARMEAKKQGKKSSSSKLDKYERLKNLNEDTYNRMPKTKGMTEEEYRRLRKEEYDRYMNMDFEDDIESDDNLFGKAYLDDEAEDYETYTFLDRIKSFVSNHSVAICIITGILMVSIISSIMIWILL